MTFICLLRDPGHPSRILLRVLRRAVPGCDVLPAARQEAAVLPAEPAVPVRANLHDGFPGLPAAAGLRGEGVAGDHSAAVARRLPTGRVRDHAAHIRDLPIHRLDMFPLYICNR